MKAKDGITEYRVLHKNVNELRMFLAKHEFCLDYPDGRHYTIRSECMKDTFNCDLRIYCTCGASIIISSELTN